MWWWLMATTVAAAAAPPAPSAPSPAAAGASNSPSPDAPNAKEGLVEALRRQLLADNEDYMPSESEGMPMRARLSDDDDEEQPARGNGTAREPPPTPAPARDERQTPAHREPSEPREPRPDRTELRSEENDPLHPLEPQQAPPPSGDGNAAQHRAVPIEDNISIEKYDQDYEFKDNKQFLENVQIDEHDQAFEGEAEKLANAPGPLKLGDYELHNPYEIELAKHFEDKAAGDSDARGGFVARARDDDDRARAHLTTHRAAAADINISKKDLLYYMDEEKFAKSNMSIGFHADLALDYKDFARTAHAANAANATRATKKYRMLKMRGANGRSGRRSGRSGRRFIQEEGATGVAILNMDAGPFPEFRLPRERRQYMHSDQSEADASPAPPPAAPTPPPGGLAPL